MVPPCSVKIPRVPTYSSHSTRHAISDTGLSPTMAGLSRPFSYDVSRYKCWAVPRSLAATRGISVDFFSCGYLDVSVPRVRLPGPMYSVQEYWLMPVGFPIRISPDQSLVADSPKLFAGSNVLHRLQLPRHPPCALIRLTIYRNNRPLYSCKYSLGATCDHARSTSHRILRLTRRMCVYHTHTTTDYRSITLPQSLLSHFHLVKEHSRCVTQTETTPSGPFGLHSRRHHPVGGAERDRTADLLRARQALSQLSYSPVQTPDSVI